MNELINRDVLIKEILEKIKLENAKEAELMDKYIALINKQPVVSFRTGAWLRIEKEQGGISLYWYICSECKKEAPAHKLGRYWFTPFCPHCGARMTKSKSVRNVGKKESHTKTSSNERTV